ncbi:MAG: bifunctional folylpolyglutamate synthase/dihydrofolate synthase [Dysgonamonadaceae bacterium]|jgi:dihydrofolate synthase/folylpolyglutamate synthase|nr:bifunctional folylpolyglutamate synthase/dihydrofolate synthase [Dysgonamonadaceae bacterium]
MNYKETVQYLYDTAPMFQQVGTGAYKEGLENSYAIDSKLNHPHSIINTIHIAGTNGKGSTSHLITSILKQSGYKVGLYTSPHLIDFKERVKINGETIEESFVIDFVAGYKDFFEEINASFFELTTALAFKYFAEKKVDVAVIEVGLGGRLDCTNIIHPDLSIITNISFDHVALLGNTLSEIAKEKAGIIKPGVPVVIGETTEETKKVFLDTVDHVHQNRNLIYFAEEIQPILSSRLLPSGKWRFETKNYGIVTGELGGFAQEKNTATVLTAVEELKKSGYKIPDDAVRTGFEKVVENTGLFGRWQVIQTNPKIVFDTGHNEAGIKYIVQQLQSETYAKLHIVIGMVNDKDIDTILKLLPQNAVYYFTQAAIPRALDSGALKNKADLSGLTGDSYLTVKEALEAAKSAAGVNDFIFVGGSTFVVADALSAQKFEL